jgi:hypothetical protein
MQKKENAKIVEEVDYLKTVQIEHEQMQQQENIDPNDFDSGISMGGGNNG